MRREQPSHQKEQAPRANKEFWIFKFRTKDSVREFGYSLRRKNVGNVTTYSRENGTTLSPRSVAGEKSPANTVVTAATYGSTDTDRSRQKIDYRGVCGRSGSSGRSIRLDYTLRRRNESFGSLNYSKSSLLRDGSELCGLSFVSVSSRSVPIEDLVVTRQDSVESLGFSGRSGSSPRDDEANTTFTFDTSNLDYLDLATSSGRHHFPNPFLSTPVLRPNDLHHLESCMLARVQHLVHLDLAGTC